MTESMIERVARAIYDTAPIGVRPWADAPAATREDCFVCARAAIAAMRWPTEAMREGWRSVNCRVGSNGMEEFTSFSGDYGNWLACHHAMIDAALNETDQ